MKNKVKLTYWISTGFISLMMLASTTMYFISSEVSETFAHLGFPDYFRLELGIAKYLGVVVLLVPAFPKNVKEWAYAGFGITFISAMIAHINVGDPMSKVMPPVFAFFLLTVSYLSYKKLVSEGK